MITKGDCSYFIASTTIVICRLSSSNLSRCYVKKRKFVYVLSFRSLSSEHRREKTVVTGPGRKTKYYIFFDYLALPEPARQVSQTEYLNAMKL